MRTPTEAAKDPAHPPTDFKSLPQLRSAAANCTACPLYRNATQTVFGEGAAHARVIFVGEQPGDEEDRAGRPFVGPAGRLLDAVLEEIGIDRKLTYVTNVVKHFKWEPRGKRRLHKTPTAREVGACLPWLESEVKLIRPAALVCLGATAARAVLGRTFKVTQEHGRPRQTPWAELTMATWHPSAVLRAPDHDRRAQLRKEFTDDLRLILPALRK